ncbi:hypothetical protein [uncultured Sulfitobacter sp.]|uniref:hypothetical protein n=1 Tax=Sulfitobacter sp. SH22 TaxID=3421172 RepID=UPI0025D758A8|nr:hypothetical protein [uncultured Sulfitobacter sp.]
MAPWSCAFTLPAPARNDKFDRLTLCNSVNKRLVGQSRAAPVSAGVGPALEVDLRQSRPQARSLVFKE